MVRTGRLLSVRKSRIAISNEVGPFALRFPVMSTIPPILAQMPKFAVNRLVGKAQTFKGIELTVQRLPERRPIPAKGRYGSTPERAPRRCGQPRSSASPPPCTWRLRSSFDKRNKLPVAFIHLGLHLRRVAVIVVPVRMRWYFASTSARCAQCSRWQPARRATAGGRAWQCGPDASRASSSP